MRRSASLAISRYLLDGVAINGVSGGPVFDDDEDGKGPRIIGVVTAYIANRATGDTLPGLAYAQDLSQFHELATSFEDISEANQQKQMLEQKPSEPTCQFREQAGLGRHRQTGIVANDQQVEWSAAYRLYPGDVAYAWHAGVHASEVAASLESTRFRIRSQIIWAKQHFAMGRGDYQWQHEPCWYAVRYGKPANCSGDRTQSTVWQVANLNRFGGSAEEPTGHGTQKPLERIVARFSTRQRQKVSSRGTSSFSDAIVFGRLGVLRLRHVHVGRLP